MYSVAFFKMITLAAFSFFTSSGTWSLSTRKLDHRSLWRRSLSSESEFQGLRLLVFRGMTLVRGHGDTSLLIFFWGGVSSLSM
jgi:hypothetical protein